LYLIPGSTLGSAVTVIVRAHHVLTHHKPVPCRSAAHVLTHHKLAPCCPCVDSPQTGSSQIRCPCVDSPQTGSLQISCPCVDSLQTGSLQISCPCVDSPQTGSLQISCPCVDSLQTGSLQIIVQCINSPHIVSTHIRFVCIDSAHLIAPCLLRLKNNRNTLANSAFQGTGEDGLPVPPAKSGEDGRCHLIEHLQLTPIPAFTTNLSQIESLLELCGEARPRYVLASCCGDDGHVTNRSEEDFFNEILGAEKRLTDAAASESRQRLLIFANSSFRRIPTFRS
jgi:hypothetical protein